MKHFNDDVVYPNYNQKCIYKVVVVLKKNCIGKQVTVVFSTIQIELYGKSMVLIRGILDIASKII